ncbi:hypothetical protein NM688_g8209 [Phlebia brevispora]|uniref:Uncharacterized protein n=1 Tax=Phlebia brevispora TaxID=194682 RepID=A0ACC1RWB6_9APHY|nr:hypothetical protein NM688_g8209 [Phlebia brevispora]
MRKVFLGNASNAFDELRTRLRELGGQLAKALEEAIKYKAMYEEARQHTIHLQNSLQSMGAQRAEAQLQADKHAAAFRDGPCSLNGKKATLRRFPLADAHASDLQEALRRERELHDEAKQMLDRQVEAKEAALRERERQLEGTKKQIEERDRQLAEMNRKLAEKDVQLATKEERLARKDRQLADKDTQLAEKDRQLSAKDMQLTEKDNQIQSLMGRLLSDDRQTPRARTAELRGSRSSDAAPVEPLTPPATPRRPSSASSSSRSSSPPAANEVVITAAEARRKSTPRRGALPYAPVVTPVPACEESRNGMHSWRTTGSNHNDHLAGQEMECPVCWDSLAAESLVTVSIPCGHLFHEQCLYACIQQHINASEGSSEASEPGCPSCRKPLNLSQSQFDRLPKDLRPYISPIRRVFLNGVAVDPDEETTADAQIRELRARLEASEEACRNTESVIRDLRSRLSQEQRKTTELQQELNIVLQFERNANADRYKQDAQRDSHCTSANVNVPYPTPGMCGGNFQSFDTAATSPANLLLSTTSVLQSTKRPASPTTKHSHGG